MLDKNSIERRTKPSSWAEVVGPVAVKDDLDPSLQEDDRLMVLVTGNEREVCPTFQFDIDDHGRPTINPHVATAWELYRGLHIEQLDESPWAKVASLTQPREEYSGTSWANVLKATDTDEATRRKIYAEIAGDAIAGARWGGIELTIS